MIVRTYDEINADNYFYVKQCASCKKIVHRNDMQFTKDCHGIPYRLVCWKCYEKLMSKGYDGVYYTEADECLACDY